MPNLWQQITVTGVGYASPMLRRQGFKSLYKLNVPNVPIVLNVPNVANVLNVLNVQCPVHSQASPMLRSQGVHGLTQSFPPNPFLTSLPFQIFILSTLSLIVFVLLFVNWFSSLILKRMALQELILHSPGLHKSYTKNPLFANAYILG